jgi:flagellar biogenesis protein FliO
MGWDLMIRGVLSLVLVLGLIAGTGLLARRFGMGGGFALRKSSRRRLGVVEQISVDNRRRLILVRKDDTEILLLVGGGNDLHLDTRPAPEPFTLPEGLSP